MGIISGASANKFKSSVYIYSKVKRFLKSFDSVNLIDEGEFNTYTKEVLRRLGVGIYKEAKAVVPIKNFKAELPDDFTMLYSAYKCSLFTDDIKKEVHKQPGFAYTIDITDEIIDKNGCEIECCESNSRILEKININTTVTIDGTTERGRISFGNIIALRLSPNVNRDFCVDECENLSSSSILEITINDGYLYTNFDNDHVYMKYYAFPVDEDGNIEIPDIETIEKAIEWYIIYQLMLTFWFNSDVQDIQQKFQKAEIEYEKAFAEAKYEMKLPAFSELINAIRNQRSQNKLVYFTRQYSNSNFQ